MVFVTKSSALQDFQRGKTCPIGVKQTPFDPPRPPQNYLKPPLTPSVTLPTTNLIPLDILYPQISPNFHQNPQNAKNALKWLQTAKKGPNPGISFFWGMEVS